MAERREGRVKVEGGDVAGVAVLVAGEGVDGVRVAVGKRLRRLESCIGNDSCVVGNDICKVSWAMVLIA